LQFNPWSRTDENFRRTSYSDCRFGYLMSMSITRGRSGLKTMRFFLTLWLCFYGFSAYAQNYLLPNNMRIAQFEDAIEYQGQLRENTKGFSDVSAGDWIAVNSGNLGVGSDRISIRYAKGDETDSRISIRLGSLDGPEIANGELPSTGSWTRYKTLALKSENLSGDNLLFIRFEGTGNAGSIDYLLFARGQQNLIQAEKAASFSGVTIGARNVTDIGDTDWLGYEAIDFGNGFIHFRLRYRNDTAFTNQVTLHLDDIDNPALVEKSLPPTNGRMIYTSVRIPRTTGQHDLYLNFSGAGQITLDQIRLRTQPAETVLEMSDAPYLRNANLSPVEDIMQIHPSASFRWFGFDDTSVTYNPAIELPYAHGNAENMRVEVRRNGAAGKLLANIDLPPTGELTTFDTAKFKLENAPEGIYRLVFRFFGDGPMNIGDINMIRFAASEPDTVTPRGILALDNIVVDQFGYRPNMAKHAVIRDPQIGPDSEDPDYIPGTQLELIDAATNGVVLTGAPTEFDDLSTNAQSGDRTWSFDFTSVTTPGTYYIYDPENGTRSDLFDIRSDVYAPVLRAAFRTFLYQRSGFEKTAALAGENYADLASHTGPLQDSGARAYNRQRQSRTERDLSGGWYDAGDFHKYSNWTADYIIGLLEAYQANPSAWSDDWDMPDSGNGIADILDEVRWGVEHLQRMQETAGEVSNNDIGGVLSVLHSDDALSPASANTGNSFYGPATTSASLTSAGAFAYAATIFKDLPDQGFQDLAESLEAAAISAYDWAEANPNVLFNNTDNGVGNGNSEVGSPYDLEAKKRLAAIYLFGQTGNTDYRDFIDSDYARSNLIMVNWASPYTVEEPSALLYYAALPGATDSVTSHIQSRFAEITDTADNGRPAIASDPYRAYLQEYTWGSNKQKSRKGHMFNQLVIYDIGPRSNRENLDDAAGYLHYIHGVNPLGKAYLSNMSGLGAGRSVDEFYHRWFADGSDWDNVNTSFGPPPGFLVGGPNEYYSGNLPGTDGPAMTAYIETNAYLDGEQSWELTENSNGYQIEYLKLLSMFVD